MMGQLEGGSAKLFYEFSPEEMVPQTHLLRKIDRFLDFDDLREHLKPFYSHNRPRALEGVDSTPKNWFFALMRTVTVLFKKLKKLSLWGE